MNVDDLKTLNLGPESFGRSPDKERFFPVEEVLSVKIEEPFSAVTGSPPLTLPESLYTIPFVIPLAASLARTELDLELAPEKTNRQSLFWLIHGTLGYFLATSVNAVIQLSFIVFVYYIVVDANPDCEDTGGSSDSFPFLNVVAIFVYVNATISDIFQTIDMTLWILYIPTVRHHQALRIKTIEKANGETERSIVSGMILFHKIAVMLLVIIPKFAIAIFLAIFGGGFLFISTDRSDLLLNTLALVFIMDIDEIFYAAFVPTGTKAIIGDLPGIPMQEQTTPIRKITQGLYYYTCQTIVGKILVLSAFSTYVYHQFCRF